MKKILISILLLTSILFTGCDDVKIDNDCLKKIGENLCHEYNLEYNNVGTVFGESHVTCNAWDRENGLSIKQFYFSNDEINSCTKYKFGGQYLFKEELCYWSENGKPICKE